PEVSNFEDKLNEKSFDDVKNSIRVETFISAAPWDFNVKLPSRSTETSLRKSEGTVVETLLPLPIALAIVIKGFVEASIKTAVVLAKIFFNITYSSFQFNLNLPNNPVDNGVFYLFLFHLRFFYYIIYSFFCKINRFDCFELFCTGFSLFFYGIFRKKLSFSGNCPEIHTSASGFLKKQQTLQ
ncbi:MAG: hypothetical protein K2O60_02870, partial [Ruminococcus sp.]|nr:hypothetical protein [Ruminococcus sp.]